MAQILEFPVQPSLASPRSGGATAAGAQIVLFPGVRYEYHDALSRAATTERKPARGSKNTRDRLEIAD